LTKKVPSPGQKLFSPPLLREYEFKEKEALLNTKGPFGRTFPSASPLAFTEALPNPPTKKRLPS
jgi:hypothetical protein